MSVFLSPPARLIALALFCIPAACQRQNVSSDKPVSTGLDSLASEPFPETGDAFLPDATNRNSGSTETRLPQFALDFEQIFRTPNLQAGENSPRSTARDLAAKPNATPTISTRTPELSPNFALDSDQIASDAAASPDLISKHNLAMSPGTKPVAAMDQVSTVAANLADNLRHREDRDTQAIPDAIVLTTLESLRPGVFAELDKPDSPFSKSLSRDDRKELLAARDRVASNPEAKTLASDSLSRTLQTFAPPATLQIPKVALCTRVQGFGRYEALSSDTFLIGKPIRTLIYTELDGFASRSARAGDPGMSTIDPPKHAVELSQSLTLYHDPSGLVAWQRPPQTIVEPCKAKRRDFFLVQRLELPATLSIGKYNLKVRVTDQTSGAEAEAILPINVVADRGLIRR